MAFYKTPKKVGSLNFKSRVTLDTAYGRLNDYGKINNKMELFKTAPNHYTIEWTSKDNPDVYADIGIDVDGKKVTEYDGVFELPKQAKQLLRKKGFSLPEEM